MQKRVASLVSALTLASTVLAGLFSPAPALGAFPGGNGKLLLQTYNGTQGIFTIDSNGSNAHQIWSGTPISAVWSPDGTRIAFVNFGDYQIYIMNSDGSNLHRITTAAVGPERKYYLAWSPDGLQLAFNSEDAYAGLFVINSDGSGFKQILDYNASQPDWAANGTIAFVMGFEDEDSGQTAQDIMTVKPDGSDLTDISNNDWGKSDYFPSWAPDSSALSFTANLTGVYPQIFAMLADGTSVSQLTQLSNDNYLSHPVISPDGLWMAYSKDDPMANAYTMDLATGTEHSLATSSEWVDWQPVTSPFVYRMANWKTHERLYTTNPDEVLAAQAGNSGWVNEGVGYHSAEQTDPGAAPVYRLANWQTHERLFTTSAAEAANAVADYPGWVNEGTAYYSVPCTAGTTTIYRLANWITHERLFTTSTAERDNAVNNLAGWVSEGAAFCEPSS